MNNLSALVSLYLSDNFRKPLNVMNNWFYKNWVFIVINNFINRPFLEKKNDNKAQPRNCKWYIRNIKNTPNFYFLFSITFRPHNFVDINDKITA